MYDVIIVGAGSMGLASSYYLTKEKKKVLLIDAFTPPHDKGSHHGETRLIRYAYGEGPKYVPFALRAKSCWEELATLTEREIFRQVGILNFTPKDDQYLKNVLESAKQFNLEVEKLSAAETNLRFPGFRLGEEMEACFEVASGVLMIENILKSYYELSIKQGAVVKENERVTKITPISQREFEVETTKGTYKGKSIIISAGAWAKDILQSLGLSLPIKPIRKTFAWYEVDENLYGDHVFPGFAFNNGKTAYYGFPSIDGVGLKIGRHDLGDEVNPDEEKIPFGEVMGDQEDLDQFLQTYMPHVGAFKYGKTCMYTMTPDEDFIIDRHPQFNNLVFAAGFSGHGFKFASAVGEALKDLILHNEPKIDLTPFSANRF